MPDSSRSEAGRFIFLGICIAALFWGCAGAIESWLLSRNAGLDRLKLFAFVSEASFYYSLSGIILLAACTGLIIFLVLPFPGPRKGLYDLRYPAAAGLTIAQFNFFTRLAGLLSGESKSFGKMMLSCLGQVAYGILLFSAVLFVAWALKKKLKKEIKPGPAKYLFYLAAFPFALNLFIYPGLRPWRWLESSGLAEITPKPDAPNVIFITIDALRPDHVSAYGSAHKTPGMDSLASQSSVFLNAYSQATWTFPSAVSFLTSNYPDAVYDCRPYLTGQEPDFKARVQQAMSPEYLESVTTPLSPQNLTIAETLRASGYRTGAFVTNWFISSMLGLAQGFDYFFSAHEVASQFGPIKRCFLHQVQFPDLYLIIGDIYSWKFYKSVKSSPYDSALINQKVFSFLKKHRHEKFFLWIHYIEPHVAYGDPWIPPPKPKPGYNGDLKPGFDGIYQVAAGRIKLSKDDIDYLKYLYDYDTDYVDLRLKELFEFLQKNRLWENSIVILSADHGEEFMEFNHLGHGFATTIPAIRVPLIIKTAGRSDPQLIKQNVELIDVAPTILELLGIPTPGTMRGKSLAPLIRGKGRGENGIAYAGCILIGEPTYTLKQDDFALIYYALTGRAELFRVNGESADTDRASEYPELASQMLSRLKQIMAENQKLRDKNQAASKKIKLSPKDIERLRALGYVK